MQRCEVILREVRLDPGGQVGGQISCPPSLKPAPGQYLLAHAPGRDESLPVALFAAQYQPPGEGGAAELELAPPLPAGWGAGMRLAVRGPLGRGFNLPASARRVGLVELGPAPQRLLPLAGQALAQGAEVVLYTRTVPARLPSEVEVLPLDSLPEALTWADFLAFDLAPSELRFASSGLAGLKKRFGLAPYTPMPVPAQALVVAPMPCGGLGECGLCAVDLKRGWKLACKDGPVFDLGELEEG